MSDENPPVTPCVQYVGPTPLPVKETDADPPDGRPRGPWVYVVVRNDEKILGPWATRHAATGWVAHIVAIGNHRAWYEVVPVRYGLLPDRTVHPNHWRESDSWHTSTEDVGYVRHPEIWEHAGDERVSGGCEAVGDRT